MWPFLTQPKDYIVEWIKPEQITDRLTLIGLVKGTKTIEIISIDFEDRDRKFTAVSMKDSKGCHIYVGGGFMKLVPKFKEAAIWHEVGHFHCGHFNQKQTEIRGGDKVVTREIEADKFAVSKVGKNEFLSFLQFMSSLKYYNDSKQEFEMRIDQINKEIK